MGFFGVLSGRNNNRAKLEDLLSAMFTLKNEIMSTGKKYTVGCEKKDDVESLDFDAELSLTVNRFYIRNLKDLSVSVERGVSVRRKITVKSSDPKDTFDDAVQEYFTAMDSAVQQEKTTAGAAKSGWTALHNAPPNADEQYFLNEIKRIEEAETINKDNGFKLSYVLNPAAFLSFAKQVYEYISSLEKQQNFEFPKAVAYSLKELSKTISRAGGLEASTVYNGSLARDVAAKLLCEKNQK